MKVNYKKLDKNAIEPTYGSEYAAGLDLYAAEDNYIDPGETIKIGTGIAVEIPRGCFGAIYARSGLATKQGLRPANCVGVVDSDYRGEIVVALHNDSTGFREIHKGGRIAQLIIQPFVVAQLNEVDDLSDTKRGAGGFGSTGLRDAVLTPNVAPTFDYGQITAGNNIHTPAVDHAFDYEQITLKEIIESGEYGARN